MKRVHRLFLVTLLTGFALRFFQLEARTNFTADQGRDYLRVMHLIQARRLTLLGPPVSIGNFFFGPLYYYLLVPALLIGKFDPLSGAVMTGLFDVAALIILFITARRLLSPAGALSAAALYASSPLLVNMVKVPLNPFLIPFFSTLFIYFLSRRDQGKTNLLPLFLGILAGALFQLHFAASPAVLVGLLFSLTQKKHRRSLGLYLVGLLLGLAPMILFEVRHQFFNTRGLFAFFSPATPHFRIDLGSSLLRLFTTFTALILSVSRIGAALILVVGLYACRGKSTLPFWRHLQLWLLLALSAALIFPSSFNDHYLIAIFPAVFLLISKGLDSLPRSLAHAAVLLVFVLNVIYLIRPVAQGYLMPPGWNLSGVRATARLIAQDNPPVKFSVAATLDGDTRALPYRYLLEARYHKIPLGVEAYPSADTLYVISRGDANATLTNPVWEISSLSPRKITTTWQLPNGIFLHRFDKIIKP